MFVVKDLCEICIGIIILLDEELFNVMIFLVLLVFIKVLLFFDNLIEVCWVVYVFLLCILIFGDEEMFFILMGMIVLLLDEIFFNFIVWCVLLVWKKIFFFFVGDVFVFVWVI